LRVVALTASTFSNALLVGRVAANPPWQCR